jgi:competence protein ComEC
VLLAVANSPAALRDDCAAAAILVVKFAKPKSCAPPGPVIDTDDLSTRGAHALRIDGGQIRIETVADTRGNRPWAPQLRREDPRPADPGDDDWPARGRRVW